MLFKKNTQQTVTMQPAASTASEETDLHALEAQLEFLQKPAEPKPVEPAVQRFPKTQEQDMRPSSLQLEPQAGGGAPVPPQPLQPHGMTGQTPNPVAPAIEPPQSILHPETAQAVQGEAAKPTTPIAPAPRSLQEVAAEQAAAENATAQASSNPRKWGRQMNYRTAVVKSGGQSNSIFAMANEQDRASVAQSSSAASTATGATAGSAAAAAAGSTGGAAHTGASLASAQPGTAAGASTAQGGAAATPQKPQPQKPVPKPGAQIHNPLPAPKKHVSKEMDYDIQPPNAQMHFDVVDMSGIDYFDIN